ncbi:hypothetical protein Zm00014a_028134, partial [Zea mays]
SLSLASEKSEIDKTTIFGCLIREIVGHFFTEVSIPINMDAYKEALVVALINHLDMFFHSF